MINWDNNLPETWRYDRFKDVVKLRSSKCDQKDAEENYLELEDIEQGTGKILGKRNTLEVESKVTKFHEGDVLFGKLRPYLEKYYLADFDGRCTGEVLAFKPVKITGPFLKYCIASRWFINICNAYANGVKMPRIDWTTQLSKVSLPLPPKPEQAAIAAHLDLVCERIDKAIALKQQQVKKLEEVWRTRLHESVTKGVNPSTLKQIGNDSYLGDVPIHWKVDRIKDVAIFNPSKPVIEPDEDVSLVPMDCVSDNGRVSIGGQITYRDVDKGLNYFQAGDVLFAKITPCMENGQGAFVNDLPTRYAFGSTEFFVIRPKPCILGKYLYYATRTKLFRQYAELNMKGAAGQQRVTAKFLTTCKIAFPKDLNEQQQIIDYLDDFRKKTTQVKARMIRQIAVLQDYRRSIIHEYVTGKKRVAA